MVLSKKVFYPTNPAHTLDALWKILSDSETDLENILIFLPSRRAVRSVEKFLVKKYGHCIILPRLVALGEGIDDLDDETEYTDVISDTERLVLLIKLLSQDASIGNITTAIPIARDLLRMQDYLENEGIDASKICWSELVDEKYAEHFQHKADLLNILSQVQSFYARNKQTRVQARNKDIHSWIKHLDEYKLVVVCGSTGSVPATADLMEAVFNKDHGRIILSGKIAGRKEDFEIDSNPYNAEYKFLKRIGLNPSDISTIEVGNSAIDFFNYAFGNDAENMGGGESITHCHLIECSRESEEASVVAEIANRAVSESKNVLVITPDAAGNQRIATELIARGLKADFSGGVSGTMTATGRGLLNMFDEWIEKEDYSVFEKFYYDSEKDFFKTIINLVQYSDIAFNPSFEITDSVSMQIWGTIKNLSDCLNKADLHLNVFDARSLLADTINGITVRSDMDDEAKIFVLGTIESRMQTADVVILTGLNEGMFPAQGYENAWLPRQLSKEIGLPSPDRKVSLQALDFMNLSCGKEVYWLRSRISGGVQTTESRFLSRIMARFGKIDFNVGQDILNSVRAKDVINLNPLDYSAPTPPADWSDVFVTELELLIHNPYAFYVKHILRLQPKDDYWLPPDARVFGNLVHAVVQDSKDFSSHNLVQEMDNRAHKVLGKDSILFHFWHKRFVEIAPIIEQELSQIKDSLAEVEGKVEIAGRNIRARADRIWDGCVVDIKTGSAPKEKQLLEGNMPQLPLEAYILKNSGFPLYTTEKSKTPIMMFLQLKNNDVRAIKYDSETTEKMISAAVEKTTGLINMFSVGRAPYEYRETNDRKYKAYDDFARCDD